MCSLIEKKKLTKTRIECYNVCKKSVIFLISESGIYINNTKHRYKVYSLYKFLNSFKTIRRV